MWMFQQEKENIRVETLCVVGTPMCTVQNCRDSTGLKWNSAGGTFPVHLEWRQKTVQMLVLDVFSYEDSGTGTGFS